jgi:glycosyltransferase involved in cell wall biosynthesis
VKILHVINCLRGGGAQALVEALSLEQSRLGHSITVACLGRGDTVFERDRIRRLEDSGIRTVRLGYSGSSTSFLVTLRRLRRLLTTDKPDVTNSHLFLSHFITAMAKPNRLVQVATIHNAEEKWRWYGYLHLRRVPRIYCAQECSDVHLFGNAPARVIDNGVPIPPRPEKSLRKKIEQEFGIPNDAVLVLGVGSMRPQKSYATAVRAMACLRDRSNRNIHYLVCGRTDGGDLPKVEKAIRDVSGHEWVHLAGMRSDVSDILASANLFLSTSSWEGLPLALLEALFAGLPAVLSPIPVHRRIAAISSDCLTYGDNDEVSIAETVMTMLDSKPPDKKRMHTSRVKELNDFTIETCAQRYMDFYRSVTE